MRKNDVKITLKEDQSEWLLDLMNRVCAMKEGSGPNPCNLTDCDFEYAEKIIKIVEEAGGRR